MSYMRTYIGVVLLLATFASPSAAAEDAAVTDPCSGTHDYPTVFDAKEMASDVLSAKTCRRLTR